MADGDGTTDQPTNTPPPVTDPAAQIALLQQQLIQLQEQLSEQSQQQQQSALIGVKLLAAAINRTREPPRPDTLHFAEPSVFTGQAKDVRRFL